MVGALYDPGLPYPVGKRIIGTRLAGLLIGAGMVTLLVGGGLLWYVAIHGGQRPAPTATPDSAASGSIKLAWDGSPSSKVIGYRILFGLQPGKYTNAVPVGNVTTATLTGLMIGEKYYIVVIAVGAEGNVSPPSNEIQVVVSQ